MSHFPSGYLWTDRLLVTLVVLFCLTSFPFTGTEGGGPSVPTGERAFVGEVETNDDFGAAQPLRNWDEVDGATGLTAPNPIDVFVIEVTTGDCISVSLRTNGTVEGEKEVHLELYDDGRDERVAWSHSGGLREALTHISRYTGEYYIMVVPWKAEAIGYTLEVSWAPPPEMHTAAATVWISDSMGAPSVWWRIHMRTYPRYTELARVTIDYPRDRCLLDIRTVNLATENPVDPIGHIRWFEQQPHDEVMVVATYNGHHFVGVDVIDGECDFGVRVEKGLIASEGEGSPGTAKVVLDGEGTVSITGTLDPPGDYIDWYRIPGGHGGLEVDLEPVDLDYYPGPRYPVISLKAFIKDESERWVLVAEGGDYRFTAIHHLDVEDRGDDVLLAVVGGIVNRSCGDGSPWDKDPPSPFIRYDLDIIVQPPAPEPSRWASLSNISVRTIRFDNGGGGFRIISFHWTDGGTGQTYEIDIIAPLGPSAGGRIQWKVRVRTIVSHASGTET